MEIKNKTIPLTTKLNVKEGSHILYFYEDEELYIENAISFILSAKTLNQKVVFIESEEHYHTVLTRLEKKLDMETIQDMLYYKNNFEFYQEYGNFNFSLVLKRFKDLIQPFYNQNISIRVWGHVDWCEQPNIKHKLNCYESEADLTVSEMGYMTLCTYDGKTVPSYILVEMMKSHQYFMTDHDLVRSSLYNNSNETIFPSLSAQRNMETEMDFYKQKLDFIHVVAHEVRNPLTVIQSYASLLKSEVTDEHLKQKLSLIEDYSVAIDHEIHHIIQTEQMFSIDTFWKKKLISVVPVIKEVVEVMTRKARTQNILLTSSLDMEPNVIINGNLMGFKLIISNLLSNAIKYSNEGGMVKLKGHSDHQKVLIEIIDYGIGMSHEQQNKLFEKYQKLNEEESGQGIGLYMVNKLVQHFEGSISVESELDKGTNVRIEFPL
ncbi:MEDS domain-containing protein [Evansella tamaricis]|uniref:histidine kinase n=1 Tax=Evansella tamaricis TaxID=2069301 RepID=A0ABS6JEA3_9BACI|nr:MEDS domain-containing protein [Evansella tamaricis]MBU9711735.1 MEDS domain-containing protein [Evansella tamaricis]